MVRRRLGSGHVIFQYKLWTQPLQKSTAATCTSKRQRSSRGAVTDLVWATDSGDRFGSILSPIPKSYGFELDSAMDYGRPSPRGGGAAAQSSGASGVFFPGDVPSPARSCLGSGPSSLLTDANSALPPQLQRSASINNTDAYARLPASPLSFSSTSHDYAHKPQSSATSQLTDQPGAASKRPRVQDDVLMQQLMQRQEGQRGLNPQLQAMIYQQRLAQQQMQRGMMQQQQQLRQQLQQPQYAQQAVGVGVKRPLDSGICARRLMQYLFHRRHNQEENLIAYWRKFVGQYFAPRAKKKWCLSMYENVDNHAFGAFPQTSLDAWQCDICGSKSGKGFEASFEVLPRLFHIKFDRGVIDELLFLDKPHECRLPNGIMVLEYAKAVQESRYEQVHVVREGQLRVIFTPELKILSWEFCARRHEEFLSRRLVAPQVSQLLQVAQKYQAAVTESGSAGVSQQDLQNTCNMFLSAGRQLVKNFEIQSLNELGFPKRYVRCLQVAEVVNTLKDLFDFSQEQKIGPIESLKNYSRQAAGKLQNQQKQEPLATANSLPADQGPSNVIAASHPAMNSHMNNMRTGVQVFNNTTQGATAWNNYQNLQRNLMSPNHNALQSPDALKTLNVSQQARSLQFQGSASSIMTNSVLANTFVNESSAPNQQHPQLSGNMPQQNNIQSSLLNQQFQPLTIDQIMQEVTSNSGGVSQQSLTMHMKGNVTNSGVYGGDSSTSGLAARMKAGSVGNAIGRTNIMTDTMRRSNSQKSISNNPTVSETSPDSKPDLPKEVPLSELDYDLAQFAECQSLDNDLDIADLDWKD